MAKTAQPVPKRSKKKETRIDTREISKSDSRRKAAPRNIRTQPIIKMKLAVDRRVTKKRI
jgi:hypothetical protein